MQKRGGKQSNVWNDVSFCVGRTTNNPLLEPKFERSHRKQCQKRPQETEAMFSSTMLLYHRG